MKKRKILKHVLITISIITILTALIWVIDQSSSIADVGSFESYSSGGSSYSSGSSYGSYSSRSSSRDDDDGTIILWIIMFLFNPNIPWIVKAIVIIILCAFGYGAVKARRNRKNSSYTPTYENLNTNIPREASIVENIQKTDPKFNADQFKSYVKDVFVKLQNAWTERDWEKIRNLESNELFEQHKAQLQGYINNNQINVMERICVNWVKIISYGQYGNNEVIEVDLNSRMGDYIIDATTKEVLKGNKTTEYVNVYRLKFTRTIGVKTQDGGQQVNVTNCPNCGAPTKVMSSGRCEYCNSVITTKDYGWVLSSLERHRNL